MTKEKTIKLSKAQKEVVSKLKNGEILHYMGGINARCFFVRENVSWATIAALENYGLVTRTEKFVVLTELGKTIELPS